MRAPVVLVIALLGLAACTRAEGPQDRAPMLETAKVPMQDALSKAVTVVPGRAVDAEL